MDFLFDPSLKLYLPLYELDGSTFKSRDAHGHLCAVTGALWRPHGHLYDGNDDLIGCGTSSVLSPTQSITLEVWFKITGGTGIFRALAGRGNTAYEVALHPDETFRFQADRAGAIGATGSTILNADEWYQGVFIFDTALKTANNQYHGLYINAELETLNFFAGADTNEVLQSTAIAFELGRRAAGANWFNGNIGEVRLYNRALTPLEIQRNFLSTKWRYQ